MKRWLILLTLPLFVSCDNETDPDKKREGWCKYYGYECSKDEDPDDQGWWDSFYGKDKEEEDKPWNSFYGTPTKEDDKTKQGWW